VHGEQLGRVAVALDRDPAAEPERLVGEQVLTTELRRIDGRELLQRLLLHGEPSAIHASLA